VTKRLPASLTYDAILPHVQKPSRYIDSELNLSSEGFRDGCFNVLLVFPDTYEIGMSYQGIRFLYHRLADMDGVKVEMAFAPWPDMEERMRNCDEPFRSYQTGTPAHAFDLIGFSVIYELHYTNLMMILDLTGLPVEATERREDDPIVVAGGPCCSNPLPFLGAVDAVFLGDGEESLPEAVEVLRTLKSSGTRRETKRELLAGITGVYVDGVSPSAITRTYRLRRGDLIRRPIVPSASIVHDRLTVEIMRGCTRGCRFCHAGMMHRPRRERAVREIVEAACDGLDASGWDQVSLLSLSTSDYSCLDELLEKLTPELEGRHVSLSLPSLRPETITERIVTASSLVRRSGFTIAPEAGTERLRRFINKGMTEGEILEGCRLIIEGGWQGIKLYFMIGLPTETEEDLSGIVDLTRKILELPRPAGRFTLGVSISPFVPKPHTPFQWERQCPMDELLEKQKFLSERMRSKRIQLSLRTPALSILEGLLARGDRKLWPVLLKAYRLGCRFDGWRDQLRFDLWEKALGGEGLEIADLTASRPLDEPLPWANFASNVRHEYLLQERERAFAGEMTPDCRDGDCSGCGACDGRQDEDLRSGGSLPGEEEGSESIVRASGAASPRNTHGWVRFRCIYEKVGNQRFLSHLETLNIIQRALRCSGLPLSFTEGFHPHPRISMGPSLPVGMEGLREFFDVELAEKVPVSSGSFNGALPEGIQVIECGGPFTRRMGKLPEEALFRYQLFFDLIALALKSEEWDRERLFNKPEMWYSLPAWKEIREFNAEEMGKLLLLPHPGRYAEEMLSLIFREHVPVKDKKGRDRICESCVVKRTADGVLEISMPFSARGGLRPRDLLGAVLPKSLATLVRVRRLEMLYKTEGRYVDPLTLIKLT